MIVADHVYQIAELYNPPSDRLLNWLEEQFGEPGHRWFHRSNRIFFYNEADHLIFILRWS